MKTKLTLTALALLALSTLNPQFSTCFAQGTAFTYQGRLNGANGPATGIYDLTFELWNAVSGGSQMGSTITDTGQGVTNGLFTVVLDFGGVFNDTAYWLQVGVRTNGAITFSTLSPRQELTPVPYAIYGENAGTANSVINGAIAVPQLDTLGGPTSGQVLAFNGTALVWTNPSTAALAWNLTGNAGTTPGPNFVGTTDNEPLELQADNERAWLLLPTTVDAAHSQIVNLVGGSQLNAVGTSGSSLIYGATISGGGGLYLGNAISNLVQADFGTVGGGGSNLCTAPFATISGGEGNTASGSHATVAGGLRNTASGQYSTALGYSSTASGQSSAALGYGSVASGDYSLAAEGGHATTNFATAIGPSTATGQTSTALGESQATGQNSVALGIATANGDYSLAVGDSTAGGAYSTAAGSAEAYGYASIAGGYGSIVYGDYAIALGVNSTADGAFSIVIGSNSITDGNYATVGGGANNTAQADYSIVGGGYYNSAFGTVSTVGGGNDNLAYGWADTIAGGEENSTHGGTTGGFAPGGFTITGASTVGGGFANQAIGFGDTVGGGSGNVAEGYGAVVSGGVNSLATNSDATVCGGYQNTASGLEGSTVCGGEYNAATNWYATVGGGQGNLAGGYASFAAGWEARVVHDHSFVWNGFPGTATSFMPGRLHVYGTNGLSVDYYGQRPDGGGTHWIVIGDGGSQFPGQTISTWTGAYLSDSGTWQNASDRNRKTALASIDPHAVLEKLAALPVGAWRYTNEVAGVKHIGPMAQDFMASFGLGTDDKTISTVDEGGVALAAIQGLNQKVNEKDAEIQVLEQQNKSLEQRLDNLEHTLKSLADKN